MAKYRLSKLKLDFVSLVERGDDPAAQVVIAKTAPVEVEKRKKSKKSNRPNPKSTPKEIVGSHGHRPHGPSILWPAMYEHLLARGMSKRKAAIISNGKWRDKRGLPPTGRDLVRGFGKSAQVTKAMSRFGRVVISPLERD